MKIANRLAALVSAAAVALAAVPALPAMSAQAAGSKSAQQILDEMGIGWNLGNSLDTDGTGDDSETFWGNPRVTKEFIR